MTRPVLVKSLQDNLRKVIFIMVKKHKSGNVNNKFAGIGLVALGLFFFVAGLSNVGTGYGVGITITAIIGGIVLVILGAIVFKKWFFK